MFNKILLSTLTTLLTLIPVAALAQQSTNFSSGDTAKVCTSQSNSIEMKDTIYGRVIAYIPNSNRLRVIGKVTDENQTYLYVEAYDNRNIIQEGWILANQACPM